VEPGSLNLPRGGTPLLELREVSVAPPGSRIPILTGVNLALRPGESAVLLGANGSGKTSLLQVAAGLRPPVSGEVRPGGGFDPGRIALVLEDPLPQFVAASVRGEIEFALECRGLSTPEIVVRRDAALAGFGLSPLADRDPRRLSAGEQGRALLAASLVREPEVLLLDDSLLHLGPGEAAILWRRIRAAVREGRVGAVILAGSDAEPAVTADRVGRLGRGRLVGWEAPEVALRAGLPEGVRPPLTLWLEERLARRGVVLPGSRLDPPGFQERLRAGGWER
jgi:energy-coupling factor transporter ATP-binding protein EcfA2